MYVLERLEGESTRQLLAAPDRASVEQLLTMIAKARARAAVSPEEREHLRTVLFRWSVESGPRELLTLDGEHFRIRKPAIALKCTTPRRSTLRRITRGLRKPSPILSERSSVEATVHTARSEGKQTPDWLHQAHEDSAHIPGERFEI